MEPAAPPEFSRGTPGRRASRSRLQSMAGFTLSEVLISAALSLMLLAGILSAFFHLTKSGIAMGNYHDLEMDTQRTLHVLFRDVLQAEAAAWENSKTLRLTVDGAIISYAFDEQEGRFTRNRPGETQTVLASGVRTLTFRAFDTTGNELPLTTSPAAAGHATKMVQVSLELDRKAGTSTNTAAIASARYMLRNKAAF